MFKELSSPKTEVQERNLRYLKNIYFIATCYTLFFILQFNFQFKIYHFNNTMIPLFLGISVTPIVARISKSYLITARWLWVFCFLYAFTTVYFSGGFSAPGAFWMAMLPLVAGILVGKTDLISAIFLTFLGYGIFYFADYFGMSLEFFGDTQLYHQQKKINLGMFLAFNVCIIYFFFDKESVAKKKILM